MPGQLQDKIINRLFTLLLQLSLLLSCCTSLLAQKPDNLAERARKIHFSSIVLDTHIDVTPKLQTDWKFSEEHQTGHIDLPRMKKGGLNGLFFSIYKIGRAHV